MDEAPPALRLRWPPDSVGPGRAHAWRLSRSVLVYDPIFRPSMRAGLRGRRGDFFRRPPVVWAGALALGALVAGGFALANPRMYSATGLLLGLGADQAASQDERAVISSDEVMRGVVDRVGVDRLAPSCLKAASRSECALRNAEAHLQVQIVGDATSADAAPMLQLTATQPDPAVAVAIVDAAVAADRHVWYLAHKTDQAASLAPQLTAAETALGGTSSAMVQLRSDAHVTNIAQDMANVTADINDITWRDNELRLRQAAANAELAVARTALQAAPATVLGTREVSSGDPGQDTRSLLLQLKLQRAHMAQLYARDYPGLAELDDKIATVVAAMKAQAQNATSVVRDIRNPLLATLSARMVTLEGEGAGLAQQRLELQRQAAAAAVREADLRAAEARLTILQQRQDAEEAVVRQLSVGVANLRAQETLITTRLAQIRLLRRPVTVVAPWTGTPFALATGAIAALVYGAGMTLMARRRRPFSTVMRASSRVLERFERAWAMRRADETQQVMASTGTRSLPAQSQAGPVPGAHGSIESGLTDALMAAARMRMFALRRDGELRRLGI
jgi:hypothetical protein